MPWGLHRTPRYRFHALLAAAVEVGHGLQLLRPDVCVARSLSWKDGVSKAITSSSASDQ